MREINEWAQFHPNKLNSLLRFNGKINNFIVHLISAVWTSASYILKLRIHCVWQWLCLGSATFVRILKIGMAGSPKCFAVAQLTAFKGVNNKSQSSKNQEVAKTEKCCEARGPGIRKWMNKQRTDGNFSSSAQREIVENPTQINNTKCRRRLVECKGKWLSPLLQNRIDRFIATATRTVSPLNPILMFCNIMAT